MNYNPFPDPVKAYTKKAVNMNPPPSSIRCLTNFLIFLYHLAFA